LVDDDSFDGRAHGERMPFDFGYRLTADGWSSSYNKSWPRFHNYFWTPGEGWRAEGRALRAKGGIALDTQFLILLGGWE
jgi:hypothetical protein